MRHRVTIVIALLASVIAAGTIGYRLLEGWPWQDALYMTIIGLTTVGFGEVHPLSSSGRLFTVGLLVTGIGTVLYGATTLGEAVVAATVRRITRRSCMDTIKALKDHIILCGYGRLGHYLARRLKDAGMSLVIIERDASQAVAAVSSGYLVLEGNATDEEMLMKAGLPQALTVIAALGSDGDNILVTLSIRELNPKCTVVARVEDPAAEKMLERAGADKVVSPLRMGSHRMYMAVMEPAIYDFVDVLNETPELDIKMKGVSVDESSRLVDQTLATSGIRNDLGLIIIAIRRASGQIVFNPSADTVIESEDTLMTMGETEQLGHLQQLASTS